MKHRSKRQASPLGRLRRGGERWRARRVREMHGQGAEATKSGRCYSEMAQGKRYGAFAKPQHAKEERLAWERAHKRRMREVVRKARDKKRMVGQAGRAVKRSNWIWSRAQPTNVARAELETQ